MIYHDSICLNTLLLLSMQLSRDVIVKLVRYITWGQVMAKYGVFDDIYVILIFESSFLGFSHSIAFIGCIYCVVSLNSSRIESTRV